MSVVHVAVTAVTITATASVAVADLVRAEFVLANAGSVGVPESWLPSLGLLKGAGAIGLALGLAGVPVIGPAAAAGLAAFFVGAVITHVRARNYELTFPLTYLALSVASLVLDVAS